MTEMRHDNPDHDPQAPALARAYRQWLARQAHIDSDRDVDLLAELAAGRSLGESRDDQLGRIAESPRNADLLRSLIALREDADQLAAGVARLRQPAHRRPAPARLRWLALAASVGLAALLALALRSPVGPEIETGMAQQADAASAAPVDDAVQIAATIMSESFEHGGAAGRSSIFLGDFDS